MDYKLALKVVKAESPEQTAERIVGLYETISKLSDDISEYGLLKAQLTILKVELSHLKVKDSDLKFKVVDDFIENECFSVEVCEAWERIKGG